MKFLHRLMPARKTQSVFDVIGIEGVRCMYANGLPIFIKSEGKKNKYYDHEGKFLYSEIEDPEMVIPGNSPLKTTVVNGDIVTKDSEGKTVRVIRKDGSETFYNTDGTITRQKDSNGNIV